MNNFSASHLSQLGQHLLIELLDCNANILNNVELVEQIMKNAAEACGATLLQSNFHQIAPFGVSGVVVTPEAHLAIHTWPEYGYAAIDLFTRGDQWKSDVAFEYLQEKFGAPSTVYSEVSRGMVDPLTEKISSHPLQVHSMQRRCDAASKVDLNKQPQAV